jgi:hypothetical protein
VLLDQFSMGSGRSAVAPSPALPVLGSDPKTKRAIIATPLPSGNIILNQNPKNEFATAGSEFIYVPNVVPGVVGLYDQVMYFSVAPGEANQSCGNQLCFVEPATEHCSAGDGLSSQGSFKSQMRRTYTPIYLRGSSSNLDETNFRRQGSHVPS